MLKEHSSKSPDTSDKRNDAPASDEDIGCDDDTNESDLDTVEDLDEIVEDLDETPEAVCTSPALPPQLPDTRDDPLNITNLDTYGVCKLCTNKLLFLLIIWNCGRSETHFCISIVYHVYCKFFRPIHIILAHVTVGHVTLLGVRKQFSVELYSS